VPVAQVRSKAKGKEKLREFIAGFNDIEELCVIYSSDSQEAKEFADSISGFPRELITMSRLGPVVGAHAGPGLLAIALRTNS
jgi:fatty acid-binding protein DegV